MPGFQDIIGHDVIKKHLKKAIESKKVSHAYIIAGETGMGRKSLANAFALTLLCEKGQNDPCMECHACKQVLSGNHPDFIYVNYKKASSIGVDDIREQIQNSLMIKPYSSYYKVYVLDEAEKMTIQAQNALLKTIEEPPPYAIILLLTTNSDKFLPTVLSRCIQLKLKPLNDSVIKNFLTESLNITESKADIYAAFSRGNLGKAIQLAESDEFQLLYDELIHLLKYIKTMDISEILNYIFKLKESHVNIYDCLDFMRLWYRDILMFKVTKDINLLIFKQEYSSINEVSQNSGYNGLEKILNSIEKAKIRLEANVNMELALELMLLDMKEN